MVLFLLEDLKFIYVLKALFYVKIIIVTNQLVILILKLSIYQSILKILNICFKYLKMKMNIHFRTNVHPCCLSFFQAPSYALLVFVPYAAPRSIHYRSITKSLRSDNKIFYHPCSILLEMKMNIGSAIFNKLLWFQYRKIYLILKRRKWISKFSLNNWYLVCWFMDN